MVGVFSERLVSYGVSDSHRELTTEEADHHISTALTFEDRLALTDVLH